MIALIFWDSPRNIESKILPSYLTPIPIEAIHIALYKDWPDDSCKMINII